MRGCPSLAVAGIDSGMEPPVGNEAAGREGVLHTAARRDVTKRIAAGAGEWPVPGNSIGSAFCTNGMKYLVARHIGAKS